MPEYTDPNRYLNQHLEPVVDKSANNPTVDTPMEFHMDQADEIDYSTDDISIHCSCLPLKMSESLEQFSTISNPERYLLLKSLELQKKESEMAPTDLCSLLPKNYQIICDPNKTELHGMPNPIDKYCIILGNPISAKGIVTTSHEIGHARALDEMNDLDMIKMLKLYSQLNRDTFIDNEDLARVLKFERDAWAFSIQTLRPYISSDSPENSFLTREFVASLIHEKLGEYSDRIREFLELNLIRKSLFFK